jgi:hypothetical protein
MKKIDVIDQALLACDANFFVILQLFQLARLLVTWLSIISNL